MDEAVNILEKLIGETKKQTERVLGAEIKSRFASS